MGVSGCLKCLKIIVFVLDFLVMLGGMAVLGLAVYLRMDPHTTHLVRASYGATGLMLFHVACYVLIAGNTLLVFTGFIGCCGAFQESRCMLGTFFIVLLLLLIAEVGFVVWAFAHKDQASTTIVSNFRNEYMNKYPGDEGALDAVDYVQQTLRCCGDTHASDWWESSCTWANEDNHRIINKLVPYSCCRRVRSGLETTCGATGVNWKNGQHRDVYTEGCGKLLSQKVQNYLGIGLLLLAADPALKFVALVLSVVFCCSIRNGRTYGNAQYQSPALM